MRASVFSFLVSICLALLLTKGYSQPSTPTLTNSGPSSACSTASGTITVNRSSVQRWEIGIVSGGGNFIVEDFILTTANVIPYSITSTTAFRAKVSNTVYSQVLTVTITPTTTVGGTVSPSVSACNSASGTLTLSGHNGSIKWWQRSTNGGASWNQISNTTTSFSYNNITQTTLYRAIVQDGTCSELPSAAATITIGTAQSQSASEGGTVTGSTTVCNSGSGNLTLTGTTRPVLRWEKSTNGGSSWVTENSTSTTLPYSVSTTTQFRAVLAGSICPEIRSGIATITVSNLSAGTLGVSDFNTACGETHLQNFPITIILSGHQGVIQRWERSLNGGPWTNMIHTHTSWDQEYIPGVHKFRVLVGSPVCGSPALYSNEATVYVETTQGGGMFLMGAATFCGSGSGSVHLSGGSSSSYNVTWQSSPDGTTWSSIPGNTGNTALNYNINTTTYYRAHSFCRGYSNAVKITINAGPVPGVISGGGISHCNLLSGTLTYSGNRFEVESWQVYYEELTWQDIPQTALSDDYSFSFPNAQGFGVGETRFRVKVANDCGIAYSEPVSVTLYPVLTGAQLQLSGATTAVVSASGAISRPQVGTVLKWQKSDQPNVWVDINNTTNSLNYSNITRSTAFRAQVQNGSCPPLMTQAATVKIIILTGPAEWGEEDKTRLEIKGYSGSVIHWEYSENNGAAWNTVQSTYKTYSHKMKSTTLFRAYLDYGAGPAYTNTVTVSMVPFSTWNAVPSVAGVNFTKSTDITTAGVTDESQISSLPSSSLQETIVYADGLGRPIQTIAKQYSPDKKDLVAFSEYDHFGRTPKVYLPYVAGTSTGAYQTTFLQDQASYYTNGPADKVADSNYPFAVTVYDLSPMQRIVEQGMTGQEWQPGSNHTIRTSYQFNEANEVRLFDQTGASAGYYAPNELIKTEVIDQQGARTIIYKDKANNIVLSKQQLNEQINGVTVAWLETYYIFDLHGRTKYILPPGSVVKLQTNGWVADQNFKDANLYQFVYDNRGRLIEKKVPGQEWVYLCYDRFNRLVLAQDASIREQDKWFYIKYDQKERPVLQGLYTNATWTTRADIQTHVIDPLYASSTAPYFETRGSVDQGYTNQSFPTSGTETQIANYYDNHDFDGNGTDDYAYTVQGLSDEGKQGSAKGLLTGSKSLILGTTTWLQQYIFYDETGKTLQVRSNNQLSTSPVNLKTYVYDFRNKVLLKKEYHYAGEGKEVLLTHVPEYDHMNRIKSISYTTQTGSYSKNIKAVAFEYNELGQVIDKKLHSNGLSGTLVTADPLVGQPGVTYANTIDSDDYNNESAFVAKTSIVLRPGFHVQTGNTFKARIGYSQQDAETHNNTLTEIFQQSIDYRYDIQGKLTSINNASLTADNTNNETNDFWGADFLYQQTETGLANTPMFNGNISAMKWKGPGSEAGLEDQQSYKYTYDLANRLKSAEYKRNSGTGWNMEANVHNEFMTYDHDGNILTLKRHERKHQVISELPSYTADLMDDLGYTYNSTPEDPTERLRRVGDNITGANGFINGANSDDDYSYTTDGHVISDENKGITNVTYNQLGRPASVEFSNGRKLQYTYDARGSKLSMKVLDGSTLISTTEYVETFIYENGELSSFFSAEGRVVRKSNGTFDHQYFITDNQGNTRVVFSSAAPEANETTVTYETANNEVLNFPTGGNLSSLQEMNKTAGGNKSHLLNGGHNSQVGISKTFKVYPGDKVSIEAFAKYYAPSETPGNLANFAAALLSAFSLPPPAGGEVNTPSAAVNYWGSVVASGDGNGENTHPKAFVNILLFDKHHNFLDIAYDQIDDGLQGSNPQVVAPHDNLFAEYLIKEEGYAYVYISNENAQQANVYFDDVTISHTPTSIIQYNEYYPYGLQTSKSWTREDATGNPFLYNAGTQLNGISGWYETMFRTYDPMLGRFMQVDPLAAATFSMSPYQYANGNPVLFNDPLGLRASSKFWVVILELWNSPYGGSWSSDGGMVEFTSHDQALQAGIDYNNRHNSWENTAFKNEAETRGAYAAIKRAQAKGSRALLRNFPSHVDGIYGFSYTFFEIDKNGTLYIPHTDELVDGPSQTNVILQESTDSGVADALDFASDIAELYRQGYGAMRFGTTLEKVEGLTQSGRFINHNGKIYSNRFFGNQYVNRAAINSSKDIFNKSAAAFKTVGKAINLLSVGAAVYQFGVSDHSAGDVTKLGVNLFITGTAFIPVVGPFLSIGLGIAENMGAFDRLYELADESFK